MRRGRRDLPTTGSPPATRPIWSSSAPRRCARRCACSRRAGMSSRTGSRSREGAWRLAAGLLAAGIASTGSGSADTYPSRQITLVVPFPPGGATDAIARITQDSMPQSLGQQVVIENIGGAGGMIAAGRAARDAPDGYTVLRHQVALAAGMTPYPNPAFDAAKD